MNLQFLEVAQWRSSGFPFVQLKYVVEWKKSFSRDKDHKDTELIKKIQYQKNY